MYGGVGRWATFTAASGIRENVKVLPTPSSSGEDAIVTWTWSDDNNLAAHAFGGKQARSLSDVKMRRWPPDHDNIPYITPETHRNA